MLSFHPRVSWEERERFHHPDLLVSDEYILDLLAIADVLFTYAGSSVVSHALAAGIPVLVFDSLGFHYKDFHDEIGMRCFEDPRQLGAFLQRLLQTKEYRYLFDLLPGRINPLRLPVDGRTGERLERIICRYVKKAGKDDPRKKWRLLACCHTAHLHSFDSDP